MSDSMRTTSGPPHQGTSHQDASTTRHDGAANPLTDAKKMGSELVGAVRESAMTMLDNQRTRAADQIASVGEALRRSAQSLEDAGGETVVRYADQAAQQITDFADTLRNRSWGELATDVEDFARRWPMAFMASAVGIGFLAGRFWMSSAEQAAGQHAPGTLPGTQTMRTGGEMSAVTPRPAIGTPVAGGAKPGFGAASTGE
jgi:hypothetical protein